MNRRSLLEINNYGESLWSFRSSNEEGLGLTWFNLTKERAIERMSDYGVTLNDQDKEKINCEGYLRKLK